VYVCVSVSVFVCVAHRAVGSMGDWLLRRSALGKIGTWGNCPLGVLCLGGGAPGGLALGEIGSLGH